MKQLEKETGLSHRACVKGKERLKEAGNTKNDRRCTKIELFERKNYEKVREEIFNRIRSLAMNLERYQSIEIFPGECEYLS
jgi:hypothetical protein